VGIDFFISCLSFSFCPWPLPSPLPLPGRVEMPCPEWFAHKARAVRLWVGIVGVGVCRVVCQTLIWRWYAWCFGQLQELGIRLSVRHKPFLAFTLAEPELRFSGGRGWTGGNVMMASSIWDWSSRITELEDRADAKVGIASMVMRISIDSTANYIQLWGKIAYWQRRKRPGPLPEPATPNLNGRAPCLNERC
jgi:hypothetical protein